MKKKLLLIAALCCVPSSHLFAADLLESTQNSLGAMANSQQLPEDTMNEAQSNWHDLSDHQKDKIQSILQNRIQPKIQEARKAVKEKYDDLPAELQKELKEYKDNVKALYQNLSPDAKQALRGMNKHKSRIMDKASKK